MGGEGKGEGRRWDERREEKDSGLLKMNFKAGFVW